MLIGREFSSRDSLMFRPDQEIFLRIDIDSPADISWFLNVEHAHKTPILFKANSDLHPSQWNEGFYNDVIEEHIACAQMLSSHGIKKLVIGADEDGVLQKMLAGRFSTMEFNHRMAPLLKIFSHINQIASTTPMVSLTIEELAPGGLDATDGVHIALNLEAKGLKEIVVSSGSKDFHPLYKRRSTQKKKMDDEDFRSNEPAMAAALWLLGRTDLSVFLRSNFDDSQCAKDIAMKLGLKGLIEIG